MTEKLLTVTVPCYNSQAYMRKALDTLLTGGDALDIIVIDDGSRDDTGKIADEKLAEITAKLFDLTPAGIIFTLDLRRPIYKKTASYGHFGREEEGFPWEKLDLIDAFKSEAAKLR